MTSTLRVERGAQRVSREDLSQFDAPESTDTWKPVRHSVLVDTMHVELVRRGLRVTKEEYAVQRNSNMLFGIMDLDWQHTGEYAAALGLRTSNDKSMSIQLAIGARIFSCTNLVFAGGLIALRRKHTSRLDLPKEISAGLDRWQEGVLSLGEGIECLKRLQLTERESKEMIYDIFRKKVVPLKLFHPVTASYMKARDDGDRISAWCLHNAFSEHVKTLRPAPQFKATLGLGKFFKLT